MSHDYTATRIIGSLPPPPGQTANFVDPPNHDAKIIALHATCLVLITFFVAMRVYVRGLVLRQFGWDDGQSTTRGLRVASQTRKLTLLSPLSTWLGKIEVTLSQRGVSHVDPL